MKTMHPGPDLLILDLGVTPDQSLPESNFFETLYPYKNRVVATSIEDASCLEKAFRGLRFVQTERSSLPFKDRAFDIAFSSAVLEHAGSYSCQRRWVQELLRVSRRFYITTPNRQFPVEVHTFLPLIHWLPQPIHQSILRSLGMPFWSQTSNLNLLTPRALRSLFPERIAVSLVRQHLWGLPSNLVAYGNSFLT